MAPAESGVAVAVMPVAQVVPVIPVSPLREVPRPATTVPVAVLVRGESPRLRGQDREHIARLAEVEGPLPPILVDRRTMAAVDGAAPA